MKLNELKAEKARLEKQIKAEQKRQEEARKKYYLENYYSKIVCRQCEGTGEICRGGADILSDPPYEDSCDDCEGRGFIYMKTFESKLKPHEMEYDERNY